MLFLKAERNLTKMPHGMSYYEYHSRCARPACHVVRNLLEAWFKKYPEEYQAKLKSDFSADDTNFQSAFWELYLHEYLLRLGYLLSIHPDLGEHTQKRPDFLARLDDGSELIVEAVTTSPRRESNLASKNRAATALRVVEEIDHPQFYVLLEENGTPCETPSGRKIAIGLRSWLNSFHPQTHL